jgi:hypothetical protein
MSLRDVSVPLRAVTAWALCATLLTLLLSCSDDNGDPPPADVGPEVSVSDATPDVQEDQGQPDLSEEDKPVIEQILPSDGFADGGSTGYIPVVVKGKNFSAGATAYIDGGSAPGGIIMQVSVNSPVSLSFNMPPNPYGEPDYDEPRKVSVAIMVDTQLSNAVDFQYTVSKPMTATYKGSIVTATMDAFSDYPSRPIEGQVYVEGVTDTTTGAAASITAQVGFGRTGTDPSQDPGWKWFDAAFDRDEGDNDVYLGQITPPLSQTYAMAYRFSQDDGKTWIYGDTDASDLAYVAAQEATLTAADAPPGYCQSDADCVLNKWMVACQVDQDDWTGNRCVMCLDDQDCVDNDQSLGPICDTANNLCGCSGDPDCANNPNGAVCLGYCGCEGNDNCVHPKECFKTQEGLQLCMKP